MESGKRNSIVRNAGFKGQLTEKQIWQVAVLVKNADKIPESGEKRTRGRRKHPHGNGDAGEPAGKIKEEIADRFDFVR